MNKLKSAAIALLAGCFATVASRAADQPIPADATGPYDNIPQWLQPVAAGRYIYPLTVFAQSPERIFIGIGGTSLPLDPNIKYDGDSWRKEYPDARADHKVFVVDRNGRIIEDWAQWDQQIQWPHRIRINPYDPEQHVWVIDRTSQQVLKFTNDGKRLVMTLGERGVAGTDSKHFGRPTDIAWLPDGTFFITDGYDNARVMKFDKDGRFLLEWGSKGTGPGQFNLVHGLTIGPDREVYVVDRDNKRIQIFDVNGKFIRQWPVNERPTAVIVDAQRNAWVLEGNPGGKLGKHDLNGKYLHSWGTEGNFPGAMHAPHDMSVDSEGAVYVSYSPAHRVDKYVPKAGADKSQLVRQGFVETTGAGLQPFVGKWKINLAKTRMGVNGPNVATPSRAPTFTWIFTPSDYGLQMDVYTEYPQPAPTRTLMINPDGKARPCQTVQPCLPSGGDPKEQSYAYHKMDDHMISRLFYVKGEIAEYDTYSVSKDGKTLVIVAWHAPTPEWQNVQVFDRQP